MSRESEAGATTCAESLDSLQLHPDILEVEAATIVSALASLEGKGML